jgi:hypothetical protein
MRRMYALIGTCSLAVVISLALVISGLWTRTNAAEIKGTNTGATVLPNGTVVSPNALHVFPDGRPIGPPPTPNGNPLQCTSCGIPAITPRTTPTDSSTPTFTAQDATDYVAAHPLDESTGPFTVVTVAFLTVQQMDAELHTAESRNTPKDQLICLVQVHGTFVVSGPPNPYRGNQPGGRTSTTAYRVFDAHTGNLLTEIVAP